MASDLFKEMISAPKSYMNFSGLWPKKNAKFLYRIKDYFSHFFTLTLVAIMSLSLMSSLHDLPKLTEIIFLYISILAYALKRNVFTFNKNHLFRLLDRLDEDILKECPTKYQIYVVELVDDAKKLSKFYFYTVMFILVTIAIFPVIENKPFPTPFPYGNEGSLRIVVYLVEMCGFFSSAFNNMALDLLTVGFMRVASAHLDILYEELANVEINIHSNGNIPTELELMNYFRQCAVYHTKIIDFVKNVTQVFSLGLLTQLGASIIVFCNTGFHILLIPFLTLQMLISSAYFVCMIVQLSMYCWFGNEIKEKSIRIMDGCYMSNWYKFSPKVRKVLLLIMERSKKPLMVEASRLSYLSLEVFATIISWSYKYFAVLEKMYFRSVDANSISGK